MEIEKKHIVGIIAAVIIIAADIAFLAKEKIFYFIIGIAFIVGALPFIFSIIAESSKERENSEMFLEFSRNLAESVKAGTPISKSIINLRDKYYGSLTPYIQKLANQISIGIPVKESLNIFSRDANSKVIDRAITLISEADKAGGEIEEILEAVAKGVSEVEKLKKERKSAISSLVVQGYIIFFVFIAIMLILQFKIIPMTEDISGISADISGFAEVEKTSEEFSKPLLFLLLTQGLFTGLVIGKLSEGTIKSGIKHSFIMVGLSILIYTGVKAFF